MEAEGGAGKVALRDLGMRDGREVMEAMVMPFLRRAFMLVRGSGGRE